MSKGPTKVRSFRFCENTLAALREMAKKNGLSPNRLAEILIRHGLRSWLEEELKGMGKKT